jgi:hypothetical protein
MDVVGLVIRNERAQALAQATRQTGMFDESAIEEALILRSADLDA